MLLGKRIDFLPFQRIVFAVILSLAMTAQSSAQSSGDLMNAIKAQQAEIDGLRARLDALVASQLSLAATQYYGSKPLETLKDEANSATPTTQQAIDQAKAIPDASLDPALRQRVVACAEGTAKAAAEQLLATPGTPITALLNGCSESEVRGILKELEQARKAAVARWQQCHEVIETVSNETVLPTNPASLQTTAFDDARAALKVIGEKGGLADDAVACVKTMDEALDSIRAQDTAAGALSAALTMASQVCAATGGNPYVCGAMLVVAILMNLFNSGNGDGNGDGKGDGKGTAERPGPYAGNDISGNEPPVRTPPQPSPVTEDNTIGVVDPSSTLTCTVTGGVMTCFQKATPGRTLAIDPAKSIAGGGNIEAQFKQVISTRAGERLFVCLAKDPTNFIDGIFVTLTDGTLAPVKLNYSSGVTVRYPPTSIPDSGNKDAQCLTAFL
ncbi:hypothetical protein [Rhizobium ruizarguesonis]|uniref:hypothetical protein n=1 Tax=Rhizobium ruizarguesonis TaxID=2081791 RepID=UPI0013BBD5B3|nr:hypothetical protein [Rhizobium ruizarguesonis]NEH61405.1 hypothetical protein [Rhizobium ruizarguesonis]